MVQGSNATVVHRVASGFVLCTLRANVLRTQSACVAVFLVMYIAGRVLSCSVEFFRVATSATVLQGSNATVIPVRPCWHISSATLFSATSATVLKGENATVVRSVLLFAYHKLYRVVYTVPSTVLCKRVLTVLCTPSASSISANDGHHRVV